MASEQYGLIQRSKEELIVLISRLLDKLSEKERIEFVSKYISPQAGLEEAGEFDSVGFLQKVESFCNDCMNRKYYVDPYYDEYNDYYYDDFETVDFGESAWASKFTEFLKLSLMYSRNRNFDVAYKAFEKLFDSLHEAECDEEIMGTEYPTDYIEADWNEVFGEYYISIKNHIPDKVQAANKAIEVWMSFGAKCTESIIKNFDDLENIEKSMREKINDNMECWDVQHQLFKLLKAFYSKLELQFDEITIAKSLVRYNHNFKNDVAHGYIACEMWREAIQIIKGALKVIKDKRIVSALNEKLVDCYEGLGMFQEAFDVAVKMFFDDNSHELYKRARSFAIKIGDLNTFTENMEKHIRYSKIYGSVSNLLRMYSFEGYSGKLVDVALKSEGYDSHDYRKYTFKSLIYRALHSKNIELPDLKELLMLIENNRIDGIVDMIKTPDDSENEQFLLNSAIKVLKFIVHFHIDAAKRSRYARAACYCALIKDIYAYMDEEDEFNRYYEKIIMENPRKTALRDEMKQKIQ